MRDTIKSHDDFHTADSDPSARSPYFFVRAKPARFPDNPRVGFMVTKRTFKLAVHRNRAKRLMRDWVQFNSILMVPEFDYIFTGRADILNTDRETGRAAMGRALKHILRKYAPKTPNNLARLIKHTS
jgi:ribonuclease P protein component